MKNIEFSQAILETYIEPTTVQQKVQLGLIQLKK
jgi:hypothetical protein